MLSVSVIIPTYNRAQLLDCALASVKDQRLAPHEVIVVDDGSLDDTQRVAEKYSCRYLALDHCGLPGKLRNAGAKLSHGSMLAFLDSDDKWLPDKLSLQTALHEKFSHLQISHTREVWMRQGKKISQSSQRHRRAGDIFTDAVRKCIMGPSTTMIWAHTFFSLGGFREDLEIAEDYEFFLRVTDLHEVGYVDTPLSIKYGGLKDNLSEKYDQIEGFRIIALKTLLTQHVLSKSHQEIAYHELARKEAIFTKGARKRERQRIAG